MEDDYINLGGESGENSQFDNAYYPMQEHHRGLDSDVPFGVLSVIGGGAHDYEQQNDSNESDEEIPGDGMDITESAQPVPRSEEMSSSHLSILQTLIDRFLYCREQMPLLELQLFSVENDHDLSNIIRSTLIVFSHLVSFLQSISHPSLMQQISNNFEQLPHPPSSSQEHASEFSSSHQTLEVISNDNPHIHLLNPTNVVPSSVSFCYTCNQANESFLNEGIILRASLMQHGVPVAVPNRYGIKLETFSPKSNAYLQVVIADYAFTIDRCKDTDSCGYLEMDPPPIKKLQEKIRAHPQLYLCCFAIGYFLFRIKIETCIDAYHSHCFRIFPTYRRSRN